MPRACLILETVTIYVTDQKTPNLCACETVILCDDNQKLIVTLVSRSNKDIFCSILECLNENSNAGSGPSWFSR